MQKEYAYILAGSEFHDAIRNAYPDIDSKVTSISFEYWNSVYSDDLINHYGRVNVSLSGNVAAYVSPDESEILVVSEKEIRSVDCQMMFYRMSNLTSVKFNNFNTDECASMRRMFHGCTSLPRIDLYGMSSVACSDYTEMFNGCSSCLSIDMSTLGYLEYRGQSEILTTNMFNGLESLRRLSVSKQFAFKQDMGLKNPNPAVVFGSDGLWHCPKIGKSFDLTNGQDCDDLSGVSDNVTYYACDVSSNEKDVSVITLGALKSAFSESASRTAKSLRQLGLVSLIGKAR